MCAAPWRFAQMNGALVVPSNTGNDVGPSGPVDTDATSVEKK